eukprot:365987-Chlamydomonas_euryale.AAC.14
MKGAFPRTPTHMHTVIPKPCVKLCDPHIQHVWSWPQHVWLGRRLAATWRLLGGYLAAAWRLPRSHSVWAPVGGSSSSSSVRPSAVLTARRLFACQLTNSSSSVRLSADLTATQCPIDWVRLAERPDSPFGRRGGGLAVWNPCLRYLSCMLLSTVGAGVLGVGALPNLDFMHAAGYSSACGKRGEDALLRREKTQVAARDGAPHPSFQDRRCPRSLTSKVVREIYWRVQVPRGGAGSKVVGGPGYGYDTELEGHNPPTSAPNGFNTPQVAKDTGTVISVTKAMELKGHKKKVMCVALSADNKRAVTASQDGTLRMWNVDVRYSQAEDPKTLLSVGVGRGGYKGWSVGAPGHALQLCGFA